MWFDQTNTDDRWAAGIAHLREVDPKLRAVIDAVGPCTLKPRRDYFLTLCRSIFSQQISVAAAASVNRKFCSQFPGNKPTPAAVVKFLNEGDEEVIRSCGLSRQKRSYVLDLAKHFEAGTVPTRFAKLSDEEIIQSMIHVRGIGRWTVEMFLIFVLNRPDVLPVDDLGFRAGVKEIYNMRTLPSKERLRKLAKNWHPYCTLATWYMWRRPKKS